MDYEWLLKKTISTSGSLKKTSICHSNKDKFILKTILRLNTVYMSFKKSKPSITSEVNDW